MELDVFGKSHVGMKRSHNEDSLYLMPSAEVYVVADGMGGHASGEVASKLAVETIADFFRDTGEDREITWPFKMEKEKNYDENRFVNSVKLANLRIFEESVHDPKKKGMGTTVVGISVAAGQVLVAHVGDSRVYLIRSGAIDQITEDHSLLNDYIKMRDLTPEEIEAFPHKNVIVRALGMKESVAVDICRVDPQPEDIFLLCSDGLSGMVDDPTLLRIVQESNGDMEEGCSRLIAEANKNGGTDNVTVILAKICSL